MDVQINFLAVLIATLTAMAIGYAWYAPFGFGELWIKLAHINTKKFNTGVAMAAAVVSAFAMALGLAFATYIVSRAFGYDYLYAALCTGLFIFFSFQGLRMFQRAQFNQNSHTETLIHIGNEFVTVMAMALVIGLFGL